MTLIVCNECGKQVSDEAGKCPGCGAPVPKPTSRLTILIGGLFAIGVAMAVFKEPPAASAPTPTPDPAREARFRMLVAGAMTVKESTKNPASFRLESAIFIGPDTMCYEFRGTNSFNAIVPGHYVIVPSKRIVSDTADAWNRYCGGKSGEDMTARVKYAL